jgi:DNA-nicking Smr family endonuclease
LTDKLSDKDKKDWQKFIDSKDKVSVKDEDFINEKIIPEKVIDLHGYTLEEANQKISEFIEYCFNNKVKKINVITGKGMRSKNINDPYQSSELGILKYSVPEFIKNNDYLMNKIIKIDFEAVSSSSKGNFDIILKTTK